MLHFEFCIMNLITPAIMFPMPSKIWCSGASPYMYAGAVTTLFCSSVWDSYQMGNFGQEKKKKNWPFRRVKQSTVDCTLALSPGSLALSSALWFIIVLLCGKCSNINDPLPIAAIYYSATRHWPFNFKHKISCKKITCKEGESLGTRLADCCISSGEHELPKDIHGLLIYMYYIHPN